MKKRGWLTVVIIFGGLFAMLVVFSLIVVSAFGDGAMLGGKRIGVVEVKGPITESKKMVEDLRRFEEKKSIAGIVVRIDSPGGAVAPSQEMYSAVKEAKKTKPVAVSMGSTAASGGYYIACGADTIYANPGTITGSIGVITQLFNVNKLLDHIDVDVETVKTGKYKDSGSPFREFTEEDREYFTRLIEDIYDQFVGHVAKSRGLETSRVEELADGRVFTGRQAKEHGLVDEVGSFHDTVEFVKKEAEIEGEVELAYPPKEEIGFLSRAVEGMSKTVSNELKNESTPLFEYRYVGP